LNENEGRNAVNRAIALALALTALAARAHADVDKVTVAMPAIAFIFATEYVAMDAGLYKKNDLDVKEVGIQGIGAANAVISGSVEFSFSSGVTLTRAAARGQPLIAIASTYDRSGFWIVIDKKIAEQRHFDPAAPLADRAKLMKGLRFAVGAINAIPHAYLKLIAKIGGLNGEDDMVVTAISPTDTIPAMQRGAIDGFSGGPPDVEEAVQSGLGVVIADGNNGAVDPPWLKHVAGNVVLARPRYCDDHKPICAKMGRALAEANQYMHDHPNEAMAILGKRLNVTDKDVLEAAYKQTLDATPSPPAADAQALATADDMNVEAGFMKASEKLPSYDKLFTNAFVK
jgi:NitT/TauT family transport system substrate-binding protein